MDYRQLIEQLNLSDETDNKENLTEVKHFSMDAADFEIVAERKKQKHPHTGPDNRGKYKRTEEQRAAMSLMMQELWSDPDFKEYVRQRQKGAPHKFTHGWSEELKKRYSEKFKDTIWINDGNNNKRHKNDQPIPKGWVRGQIRRHNND